MDSRCEFQEKIQVNEQPRKKLNEQMLLKVDKESGERDDNISPASGGAPVKVDSGRM